MDLMVENGFTVEPVQTMCVKLYFYIRQNKTTEKCWISALNSYVFSSTSTTSKKHEI